MKLVYYAPRSCARPRPLPRTRLPRMPDLRGADGAAVLLASEPAVEVVEEAEPA